MLLGLGGFDDGAAVFERLAKEARAAEEAGFDAICVGDHLIRYLLDVAVRRQCRASRAATGPSASW